MSVETIRLVHSQLVLSTSFESLKYPEITNESVDLLKLIAQGESYKVLQNEHIKSILESHKTALFTSSGNSLSDSVLSYISELVKSTDREVLIFVAVASLQTFIQNNFTGPQTPLNSYDYFYGGSNLTKEQVQQEAIKGLTSYGQAPYQEAEDPLLLLFALHIFEKLSNVSKSLLLDQLESTEEFVAEEEVDINDPLTASIHWWRSRAIQIQLSLYPEFSGPHIAVSSSLFNPSLPKALGANLPEELQKNLSIVYYLEKAKNSLESNLEHLALPNLISVQKLTEFQFVLTGARAKRTKFQQTAHSSLVVLAKSNNFNNSKDDSNHTPENFNLNSDLLLEKPHYENVGEEDLDDQIYKKQKTDLQEIDYSTLLPVSLRQEYIPESLRALDPNSQPNLSDYDNLQLLLRLYTLRRTSPSNDGLVDQQLMSLVSRVLYQSHTTSVNYSIFSRGLWERSVLETTRARTIERGILQMQSLVEEIGLKIKSRYVPAAPTLKEGSTESTISNARLRYIYQLPLLPRWSLDTKLAEKYMSLGIVKSAIEIYERLHLEIEVALCHAAIGEEELARRIIRARLERNPSDARATSVLGDLTQDPQYWEKAWELGKYNKAKISLGKYYYAPPKGVEKNLGLAIKNIGEALAINPISFDNWFFYGCLGLEAGNFELSAEAFTRCVSIDDTNSNSWSNLATSLLRLDKAREAFNALKKATSTSDHKRSWRLWENYLIVAAKLQEWDEVLIACKKLVDVKRDSSGEGSIDIPVVEKLVEILMQSEYKVDRMTFFQRSLVEFTTVTLPGVINTSSRLWRIIARVELWRKRPWASLECHEKAYRALSHNSDLEVEEKIWNETVEACSDLVAAYESLGELPGKHDAGDLVCKDWRYKAKSTIKSLLSKGKNSWEDSEGWERLIDLRSSL